MVEYLVLPHVAVICSLFLPVEIYANLRVPFRFVIWGCTFVFLVFPSKPDFLAGRPSFSLFICFVARAYCAAFFLFSFQFILGYPMSGIVECFFRLCFPGCSRKSKLSFFTFGRSLGVLVPSRHAAQSFLIFSLFLRYLGIGFLFAFFPMSVGVGLDYFALCLASCPHFFFIDYLVLSVFMTFLGEAVFFPPDVAYLPLSSRLF